MKIGKRILCMVLAFALISSICAMAASHPFKDVASGSWYEADVQYVYEKELMGGTAADLFAPNVNMNRAMLVTVLYRLEGAPAVEKDAPFTDVKKNTYYFDAVAWAYENEIVNGISATLFAPGNNITREQMITIFARYARFKGLETLSLNDLTDYDDRAKVSSYALDAFRWGVGTGIINGTSATTLAPQGTATRAQCAAILHRFIEWTQTNDREDWETEEI